MAAEALALKLRSDSTSPAVGKLAVQPTLEAPGSGARFSDAMEAAHKAQDAATVKSTTTTTGVSSTSDIGGADARARQALRLGTADPAALAATSGDVILKGITNLRGLFDTQVDGLAAAQAAAGPSLETMYKLQAAAAEFSVKMDVITKTIGKTDQFVNGLLKAS